MKRPTWATVVGVLGIISGILGLLGAGQLVMTPKMAEMQKQVLSSFEKSLETATPEQRATAEGMKRMIDTMWGPTPSWAGPAFVVAGIVAAIVNGFYIYASIALLQVKQSAIILFYVSAALSIIVTLARSMMFVLVYPVMGFGMALGGSVGTHRSRR